MDETKRLAGLIQERLSDLLVAQERELADLGSDVQPLFSEARSYLTGGKRLRAGFAVLGYRSVRELDLRVQPEGEFARILDVACALELFHAAALIHDDIIDRSDTRRGRPSVHRTFATLHRTQQLRGEDTHFGLSAAILLGDLLQSWADQLLQHALDTVHDRSAATQTREHFNRMRSEVALGQYLDVFEEQQPGFASEDEQLARSTHALIYKSAKYSVEAPLLIGAALAGASDDQESALSDFGLPVGVAFQLRDDLLGVFGDSEITGKPSGDDLREGKRTILVTLARETLPGTQRRLFDEMLGDRELDDDQIEMMQRTIRDSGAALRVEQMITRNVNRASAALDFAPLRSDARERLVSLADRAVRRVF